MNLKAHLAAQHPMVGVFLKTPSSIICEVLGATDLDMICIDAEHAPFDRRDIDACLHALRAAGKHSLVRIQSNRPEHVLSALDCGAAGILAPHVSTAEQAASLVANAHYETGRGYAGSSRAAGYGTLNMAEHKKRSATSTVVIVQIENADALDNLDDIFAVDGIDAFFLGRADLSVSLGADSPNDPMVIEAVEMVCRKAHQAGSTMGMYTADLSELPKWRALGTSFFLLGSDHAFMLEGAAKLSQTVLQAF